MDDKKEESNTQKLTDIERLKCGFALALLYLNEKVEIYPRFNVKDTISIETFIAETYIGGPMNNRHRWLRTIEGGENLLTELLNKKKVELWNQKK